MVSFVPFRSLPPLCRPCKLIHTKLNLLPSCCIAGTSIVQRRCTMQVLTPAQENIPTMEPPCKQPRLVESFRVLRMSDDAVVPVRGSKHAAGYDLSRCVFLVYLLLVPTKRLACQFCTSKPGYIVMFLDQWVAAVNEVRAKAQSTCRQCDVLLQPGNRPLVISTS